MVHVEDLRVEICRSFHRNRYTEAFEISATFKVGGSTSGSRVSGIAIYRPEGGLERKM